jgi:competence protein ComEC
MEPVGDGAMRVTTAGRSVIDETVPTKVGALSTRLGLRHRLWLNLPRRPTLSEIAAAVRDEVSAQAERGFLWTPVAFGAGSAVYFSLKTEPDWIWACAPALVSLLCFLAIARWTVHRALYLGAVLLVMTAMGFVDAKLVTQWAAAPVAPTNLGVVRLEGWVVDVASPSKGRPRLLIAPTFIGGLSPAETPVRVRVTLKSGAAITPGHGVTLRAILDPPPGPASPGGYDFARDAWFDRVGAVGLALTPPEEMSPPSPNLGLKIEMTLNNLRWRLAQRLAEDLQAMGLNRGAGLVAAVTTSHQDWLDPADTDDLRNSGLAHMLAIAGLHTAAVTGFVFAAIRLLVAAWPWLALRVSGKKLAALGGLVAVAVYLALSGAHPPARRAAITASVAFLAILLDRRAVSLHSLALAALIILVLQPVAVVEPGFQMSFSATAALVALAELWPKRGGLIQAPWYVVWPQKIKDAVLGLIAVSVVAGAATGPFAIQHFNRMASYGTFANLFADLLASAVLMPALVVAGIGEALGVAPAWLGAPLAVAGWSGQGILAIAHTFSNAPGASHTFASAPPIALLVSFLGIVVACLWKGRLRWGAAPLAFAVLVWPRGPAPAAWLAADGANAAVVVDGRAIVLKPTVRAFASDAWTVHRGLITPFDPQAEAALAFDCNKMRCLPHAGVTPAIGAWWTRRAPKPDVLDALCRASAILVLKAQVPTPPSCDGVLVLRPSDFARGGSAEVYPSTTGEGWRLDWSSAWRGVRPWTGEGR